MVDAYVDTRGSIWLLHCAVYAQRQGLWFVQAMAASSTDDIPKQLVTLLGMETVRIRKTDEEAPKVSVIDVAVAVPGHDANHAGQAVRNVCEKYPDVHEKVVYVKFPDARGRMGQKTPVADVKGIVEIIALLPGQQATRVRRQAAELLVRYLGGDLGLVDEVIALRGLQEELAGRAPEDPRRLFGVKRLEQQALLMATL